MSDISMSETFTQLMAKVDTAATNLKSQISELSAKSEVSQKDLLEIQFKMSQYNSMMELTSTVVKKITDEVTNLTSRV